MTGVQTCALPICFPVTILTSGGNGGTGGGGNGKGNDGTGDNGGVNTGGGGGGGGGDIGGPGGSGGKGVVVLRYENTRKNATTTGSPTFIDSGGYKIYVFNDSGTIMWD